MAVAGVKVGADLFQFQGNHRRRVGAIDDGDSAAPFHLTAHFWGRQHQAGRGQDVAEEHQPGAFVERGAERGGDFLGIFGEDGQAERA